MAELNLDLVDARTFLAIDDEKSIRAAARRLDISPNTLRYRLKRLESRIGTPLFRRTRRGVEASQDGRRVRRLARAMLAAAAEGNAPSGDILVRPGQVTIACGEGLGALWLTPLLGSLRERLGDLAVGLVCDPDHSKAHSDRADLGISFVKPDDPDLIVSRLGTLHFRCYGSESYFRSHGIPEKPEDLRRHTCIEQDAPGLNPQLRAYFVGEAGGDSFIRFRTTSSIAMYYAVASGAGLAFLPTYASYLPDPLRMVELGVPLKFDMNYFFHADAKGSAAVRAAADWLKSIFDPHVYPCFADEFVHPDEWARSSTRRAPLPPSPPDRRLPEAELR